MEVVCSIETKEAEEVGRTFSRVVMGGGDGNPGSFFLLLGEESAAMEPDAGNVPGKEGSGEGGSVAVPPPAWRRQATMVVVVAGD